MNYIRKFYKNKFYFFLNKYIFVILIFDNHLQLYYKIKNIFKIKIKRYKKVLKLFFYSLIKITLIQIFIYLY